MFLFDTFAFLHLRAPQTKLTTLPHRSQSVRPHLPPSTLHPTKKTKTPAAEEEDEDNMEEIDTNNIVGRRTRGKNIDWAEADKKSKEAGDMDDEDEDEDDDFEEPEEDKMEE